MGYILSVYLHILLAAFWIGGMLFLPLVVLPGLRSHPDRTAILFQTGMKFRLYGWIVLGLLLLTGLGNWYWRGLPFSWAFLCESGYGRLLGYKLLLFTVMLLLSAVHDFYIGGKAIAQMQQSGGFRFTLLARWSGRLNLLLALAMAFIGAVLSRGGWAL